MLRINLLFPVVIVVVVLVPAALLVHSYTITRTQATASEIVGVAQSNFEDVEQITSGELEDLRRFRNKDHVERAEALGVPPPEDREAASALVQQDALVPIETNPYFVVRSMDHSVPYVTAEMKALLTLIGVRFHEALADAGLPPFRFVVTSATRTLEDQAALSRVNVNAADRSSHFFGTTVDLHYGDFSYAPERHELPEAFGVSQSMLSELVEQAGQTMAEERAEELKAILGRVLLRLQQEGKVLVIYERLQPVYHITLNAPIDETALDSLAVDRTADR